MRTTVTLGYREGRQESYADTYDPNWERISKDTARLKVPGGWIVHTSWTEEGEATVYIPDPLYTWEVVVIDPGKPSADTKEVLG